MNPLRLLATALLLVIAAAVPARADFTFPKFSNYVVDAADVLPPEAESALVARLKAFQDRSGHQFAVATVPSLQGTSIEDYGNHLFRDWKLGDKERNDGALLLVAPNERKVRIEVGYGLEGDLTDAVSRLIIENAILPRFKAGDMAGGISRGADDVMAVFSGQAEEFKARAAATQDEETPTFVVVFLVIFFILMAYIFYRAFTQPGGRARRRGSPWIVGGPTMGGGGWSGGGGGGGFSGGGGGSSGGGGASGGW